MSCVTATAICAPRGSTPVLMARLEARDGDESVLILQADVSAIVYSVRDLDDVEALTGLPDETAGGSLTVSAVIFDTIQTGDVWDVDGVGYNFLHTLAAADIDQDEHRFLVEYSIKLTDGSIATWTYEINSGRRYRDFP